MDADVAKENVKQQIIVFQYFHEFAGLNASFAGKMVLGGESGKGFQAMGLAKPLENLVHELAGNIQVRIRGIQWLQSLQNQLDSRLFEVQQNPANVFQKKGIYFRVPRTGNAKGNLQKTRKASAFFGKPEFFCPLKPFHPRYFYCKTG